jgi:hypothetical protein
MSNSTAQAEELGQLRREKEQLEKELFAAKSTRANRQPKLSR